MSLTLAIAYASRLITILGMIIAGGFALLWLWNKANELFEKKSSFLAVLCLFFFVVGVFILLVGVIYLSPPNWG